MKDFILVNLNNRFQAIEKGYKSKDIDFDEAIGEYGLHIATSKELSDIVKKLAHDHSIDRKIFQLLFNLSLAPSMLKAGMGKDDKILVPLFWDESVEKDFKLVDNFQKMVSLERKRIEEAKKQNISLNKVVIPEDVDELKEAMDNDECLFKVQNLHNNIVEMLTKGGADQKEISFDIEKSTLCIGSANVRIRKFSEQYHVLKVIFSDKHNFDKEWFFSEIAENIDEYKKYTNKDFHNYFSAIKRRIAAEIGVKDLFLTTNQSVKINTDYL